MSISFKHPSNCFHFRKLWLLSYLGTNNQVCIQNKILKKGIFDTLIFMQMENSKNYIFSLLDNNHGADFLWHEFSKLLKGVVIYMYDIQMSGLPYALHLVFLKKSRVAYHRQWRRQNKGFSYNSLYFNTRVWSGKKRTHFI